MILLQKKTTKKSKNVDVLFQFRPYTALTTNCKSKGKQKVIEHCASRFGLDPFLEHDVIKGYP